MPSGLLFLWASRTGSVEEPEEPMELGAGRPILGCDGECEAQLGDGGVEPTELHMDTCEIDVRVVPGLVPGRLHRLPEPGDGLLGAAERDQVGADVVVGVAERGIDRDRAVALPDRPLVVPLRRSSRGTCGPRPWARRRGTRRYCSIASSRSPRSVRRVTGAEELLGLAGRRRVPRGGSSASAEARPPGRDWRSGEPACQPGPGARELRNPHPIQTALLPLDRSVLSYVRPQQLKNTVDQACSRSMPCAIVKRNVELSLGGTD